MRYTEESSPFIIGRDASFISPVKITRVAPTVKPAKLGIAVTSNALARIDLTNIFISFFFG
jgi:hypothetical protein